MLSTLASVALLCAPPTDFPERHFDAAELLSLRDMSALSVAPDGSRAIVQVQRADAATNSYQSAWCAIPLRRDGGAPVLVGDGGDIALTVAPRSGRRSGVWETLLPRWSPDMRWIAYVTHGNGRSRLAICASDGSGCRPPIEGDGDVIDLAWSRDSAGVVFLVGPSRARLEAEREREAAQGFRLDGRFDLFYSLYPIRHDLPGVGLTFAALAGGVQRPASTEEIEHYRHTRPQPRIVSLSRAMTVTAVAPVAGPDVLDGRDVRGWSRFGASGAVWTEPADADLAGERPPLALYVASGASHSPPVRCADVDCVGYLTEYQATPDGTNVVFVRRVGWGQSRHEIGIWSLRDGTVRSVLSTDDVIRLCTPLETRAVCLHEGPTSPRRIVSIEYSTGEIATLFDPNPGIAPGAFSPARKIQWRTPLGDEAFGYLVTPMGRRPDERLPLIIVQYRATGFLRGGTGDEYPVQAFARRGFAVVVLERPDDFALQARVRDAEERLRLESAGLRERRRVLAALTSGIDLLVEMGVADRNRVGITGLSDGAQTASFALIHCNCIAAAAISGNPDSPLSLYITSDDRRLQWRREGLGDAEGDAKRWREFALALNADRIDVPILAQVADRELLHLVQAHRTFMDAGRPMDLYVFPDEYHVKWQPHHRRAIYERNLDWFTFWLQNHEDASPTKAEQYARWRDLRAKRQTPATAASPDAAK